MLSLPEMESDSGHFLAVLTKISEQLFFRIFLND